MTCDNERHLRAYLDGALAYDKHREIAKHLGSCKACAGKFARLKQASALFRKIPCEKAPNGFETGVMSAIRGAAATPAPDSALKTFLSAFRLPALRLRLVPACGLAALVLISLLSIKAIRSANSHDRIVRAYFENRKPYAFQELAAVRWAPSYEDEESGGCRWSSCGKRK